MKESPTTSTLDPQKWPQYEGQWRQRTKYAFFRTYMKTPSLHVPWERYFVACQYNGHSCSELPLNGVSIELKGVGGGGNGEADADKDGVYVGNSHWTLDPGRIYGYEDAKENATESLKTARSIPSQTVWPDESPVRIVTTAKYQCFQVRKRTFLHCRGWWVRPREGGFKWNLSFKVFMHHLSNCWGHEENV